jgi:nucleotide-binding universal stress UspA family protein
MYKHILIAIDGSEIAGRALAHGLILAQQVKARVTLVYVTQLWSALDMAHKAREGLHNPTEEFEKIASAAAKTLLETAAKKAAAITVPCDVIHVPDQHPAEGIVATAEKVGADLIIMGSHGRRALGRLLLGSQAVEVLSHSKVPTLIVR